MTRSSSKVDAIDKSAACGHRIVAAVLRAIVDASMVEASDDAKVAVMMSGEIVDAMMTIKPLWWRPHRAHPRQRRCAIFATNSPSGFSAKRGRSKKIPSFDPRSKFTPLVRRIEGAGT
jgi:hypothetical protein